MWKYKVVEKMSAPMDQVWRVTSNFGDLHLWLPGIQCRLVAGEAGAAGALRLITSTANPSSYVYERLDSLDAHDHSYTYSIQENSLLLKDYHAYVKLTPGPEPGTTAVSWSYEMAPNPQTSQEQVAAMIGGMFRSGLQTLKLLLAGGSRSRSAAMAGYDKKLVAETLLTPVKVGSIELKHRVMMAALTRTRNDPVTEAPREINKLYYSQRTSEGGLLLSEGCAPSWAGSGYIRAPGVWSDAHIEGWKLVTEEVHRKGGFIFCQLMHAGRVSHSSLLPDSQLPVAPSAVKMNGLVHVRDGKVPYETPRALELEEIPQVVQQFVQAAKRAMEAGFDGVELHSANGYILQQFLSKVTNLRTDEYGGSVENRARFLLEVVDACIEAIGADRLGIKLSPGVTFSDLTEDEEDSLAQLAYLGPELEKRNIAFVELASYNYEPYDKFVGLSKPNFEGDVWLHFRKHYKGTIVINGGLSPQKAAQYIKDGTADLASFGVLFLANANLADLLRAGKELNMGGWDTSIWYGKKPEDDAKGYTDWPFVSADDTIEAGLDKVELS